jgi:hypothetical protein
LIRRCHWIWKESGHFPNIREVARMDQSYVNDMMNFDALVAYVKTQQKKRTG